MNLNNQPSIMAGHSITLDAAGATKSDYSDSIKGNRNFTYHAAGSLSATYTYLFTMVPPGASSGWYQTIKGTHTFN